MPQLKRVQAHDYLWEELRGLSELLDFSANTERDEFVSVEGGEKAQGEYGEMFGAFSTTLQYMNEAVEFKNRRILVCATVSSWLGTFASHDRIEIKYYGLTPASHKANKRKS